MTFCYFNEVKNVSKADLDMLSLLSLKQERKLEWFCREVAKRGIFKSSQAARNAVTKAEENKLIIRQGVKKNILILNPAIRYCCNPNILVNYNLLAIGTPEPPGFIQETR